MVDTSGANGILWKEGRNGFFLYLACTPLYFIRKKVIGNIKFVLESSNKLFQFLLSGENITRKQISTQYRKSRLRTAKPNPL